MRTPQLSEVVEGPVFLMLDTAVDHTRKDLPVSLYETGEGERGRGVEGWSERHAHTCQAL